MKAQLKSPRLLASVAFALVLTLGFGYYASGHRFGVASAQSFSLNGSYGYLISHPDVASIVGVLSFDGQGNITGLYNSRNTENAGGSGSVSGFYSVSSNGVGSITLNFDTGLVATGVIVLTAGNSSIQMVFNGGIPGVSGTATRQ